MRARRVLKSWRRSPVREAASARRAGVLPPGVAQDVDVPESGLAPSPEPAQNRKHPKKVAIHSEGVFLMKIFLDTANLEEIRQGVALGVVDGVTTNPTLVAKENRPFREHILKVCEIVKDGVVNAEVVSTDVDGILSEAR